MRSKTKRIIAMIVAVVMVVLLVPVTPGSAKIYAAELADGTYKANDLTTAVLSMYHFTDPKVVIKGDEAWLITTEETGNTVKRFDGMAYGPQSQILDPSDPTNRTLVEGTPTARVVPIYKEDGVTLETRTFVLPVPKAVVAECADIYYMIKYVEGYSESHDGDWYKASGGDYYLTGYTLEYVNDSTALPGNPVETELAITNETTMFKAVTASYILNADGSATLKMALSGAGYRYLYKGTYEQAAANGAATENWIAGQTNADGKWEFLIPIEADEIGKVVPVVAISNSYYEKYLNGQNSLERAFYPRQLKLDTTANTLVTGDYEQTITLAVTNNISMFRPGPEATLHVVGGPNSNNYAAELILPMTTASLSEAFVGYPDEAADAQETIAFDAEAMTFTIPVKWVETFGDPTTAVNLCNGEPFTLSTKSASNGKWYGRTITINEDARTLVFDTFVDPRPANTVDELIAKIQVQYFTDTTWADCEAAKAAWDALTDAEKLLVEEYDYFGLDTGDASADDPRNQDGIGEKEILVVSFGTSFNDSRVATIKAIEDAIDEEFGDEYSVRRAFTAQIIINHIYARDGEKIDNMKQALDRAVANGVKELVVQPTHLMHGAEYDELVEALEPYQSQMTIIISEPLLGQVGADATVINADKLAVAKAVVAAACNDAGYADAAAAAADGAAIVLMGHGTAHVASITYEQMQTAMGQLGYENVFIGTVEGEPESTECSNVIAAVKAAGYTKVYLRPLMVVAGDHANNDMADPEDEESWFSQFTAEGNFAAANVFCQIKGLGEIPAVQQIYIQHIKDVLGIETELAITNNTGMFKAVTASYVLNADGSATLRMALSGTGYHYLYKGTYEQAAANGAATENWIAGYENTAGKWEFLIPVAADEIGKDVPVVAVSQSYYEKYLNGQNSLERAFYPRQFKLDTTENTLVTGDFEKSDVLAITNNVSMFKLSGAVLNVVGGPNSNNYKADLVLTMGSTAYTKAFLGRIPEANAALAAGSDAVKELGEDNTFTIPVKWVETFGQPETLVDMLEEPFIISFYSNKNQIFYERQFTVDEAAKTLVVDPVLADYTAVDAALATVPENLSIYTEESVAAVTAAVEAVERGLTSDKQEKVDAMAQAIIDAVAGLIRADSAVELKAANLTLEDKIKINFKVVAPDEGYVAKLYYEKAGFAQVAEVPLNSANFVSDPENFDYYLVSFNDIPAKEMTQLLRIKVFDSNGTQVQMEISSGKIDQFDYSVATWCNNKINAAAPVERDVMIAKALLNYGHYSQLALKYNDGRDGRPENLPAASLESEMDSVTANTAYDRITDGGKELGAKSFALVLESSTSIKLKLSRSVSVKIDGAAVTPVAETESNGTAIWAAYSSGVPAKKLHELKPFELTEGSNSATLYYGCLSWANSKLANGSEDDQNLARAMYLYNAAARRYFNYQTEGLQ